MDALDTIAPKSDQQNYDDYIGGPKTVTVSDVKLPGGDQPMHLHLAEFPGRPYKPAKSMRRLLIVAWGPDTKTWVGRRITLYGDSDVKFGGQAVGGIRIAALSHIDRELTIALTVSRGKRAPFVVKTITTPDDTAVTAALDDIAQATSINALKAAWDLAGKRGVQGHPDVVSSTNARKAELEATTTEVPE
ncbi:hypothetical protein [Microbacterium sp. KNMS]